MPLIHRYAVSSEYAELLSTRPGGACKQSESRSQQTWLSRHSHKLSTETAAWHDALCPSIHELQAVFRRMRADPDLSQNSIFGFSAPLFIFVYLVVVSLVVLRVPKAHVAAMRVLDDPEGHKAELATACAALTGGIVGGVVILRLLIWGVAHGLGMFTEMQMTKSPERTADCPDSFGLTDANVLIGGIFM